MRTISSLVGAVCICSQLVAALRTGDEDSGLEFVDPIGALVAEQQMHADDQQLGILSDPSADRKRFYANRAFSVFTDAIEQLCRSIEIKLLVLTGSGNIAGHPSSLAHIANRIQNNTKVKSEPKAGLPIAVLAIGMMLLGGIAVATLFCTQAAKDASTKSPPNASAGPFSQPAEHHMATDEGAVDNAQVSNEYYPPACANSRMEHTQFHMLSTGSEVLRVTFSSQTVDEANLDEGNYEHISELPQERRDSSYRGAGAELRSKLSIRKLKSDRSGLGHDNSI